MPLDKYDGSPLWPASYCGERATDATVPVGLARRLRARTSRPSASASVVDSPRINALATASAPGVSGVLEEALLAVEPPEVERQAGGGHDADERHREEDEDLALGRTSAPTSRAAVVASSHRHQFATIVTSDVSPSRPFMSLGRNCGMIGMTRSWW